MWGRLSLGSTDQRWVAQPQREEQTRNTQSRVPDHHQEGPRTPSSIRDHVSNHQQSRAGLRAETGGTSCWSRQDNSTAGPRKHRAQTFPRVTCGRLMTQEWAETLVTFKGWPRRGPSCLAPHSVASRPGLWQTTVSTWASSALRCEVTRRHFCTAPPPSRFSTSFWHHGPVLLHSLLISLLFAYFFSSQGT